MATVLSHAVAAMALQSAFSPAKIPRRWLLVGAVFSMAPDVDVIGFRFGIHYGSLFGHRGFTHSLFFAALLACLGTVVGFRRGHSLGSRGWVWFYLFLATASHAILDAMTNGGYGVAFFSPFVNTRYFFPFAPIEVSPIGGAGHFFASGGWRVLASEVLWIWVPSALFTAGALLLRRALTHKRSERLVTRC